MAGATDPGAFLRRDPVARQALPAAGLPRSASSPSARRSCCRAVRWCSGSTACRTPTTPTASAARSARSAAASAASAPTGSEARSLPVIHQFTWFENAGTKLTVGTQIDGLAVMMMFVVTLISLLVHVYSLEYMRGDRRFTHFYAALSLFTASMLLLVVASNTLQMLVGWELVGLCSFMLIGHWWEEKPNSDAALKAFLTTRTGDIGLLIGVIMTYYVAQSATGHGTFNILVVNASAASSKVEPHARVVDRARVAPRDHRQVAVSSRCTRGCPTRWPALRRCRRSSTQRRWWSRACTSARGSTRSSGTGSRSALPATAASTRWR